MLLYSIVNGLFAALCYYAVTTANPVASVLFSLLCALASIGLVLALAADVRLKKNRVVSFWVDATYNYAMAAFLLYNGWWVTGAAVCFWPLILGVLDRNQVKN